MIALFSALLGFVSSAVPECLTLFREGRDRAHEIALLQMQIAYDREKSASAQAGEQATQAVRLQEIAVNADQAEANALNARLKDQLTGIHWVDALAGSVRPVITYAFFLVYGATKYCQFRLVLAPELPWLQPMSASQAIVSLWTEEDIALFSAVMAFWFGQRAMQKLRK